MGAARKTRSFSAPAPSSLFFLKSTTYILQTANLTASFSSTVFRIYINNITPILDVIRKISNFSNTDIFLNQLYSKTYFAVLKNYDGRITPTDI